MSADIVRMREDHLNRIIELEQLCFPVPWTRAMMESELRNPIAYYFVAEQKGVCVGYAGMQLVVGEGYITNIAVDPGCRREGLGAALMEALISCARERDADFLTLEVRLSNNGAQELYRRFGFAEEGIRQGYYESPKEDAILMTKRFR